VIVVVVVCGRGRGAAGRLVDVSMASSDVSMVIVVAVVVVVVCYVFILSWYRALTCTNVSSLFVLPARLFALTGLISDLAAISILSSYVPLCASSLTFPYLYRLSHAYVAFPL
jgi:hypothetical protein